MEKFTRKRFWGLLFTVIYSVGFIVGAVVQHNERISDLIRICSENEVSSRINNEALRIFGASFVFNFIILFIVVLSGISKIGVLLNVFLLLFLGMGRGALISGVVCDSGVHGLVFSVLVLMPGIITASVAIVLSAAQMADVCTGADKTSYISRVKTLLIYLFLIIFSSGLDVTSAEIYKALM